MLSEATCRDALEPPEQFRPLKRRKSDDHVAMAPHDRECANRRVRVEGRFFECLRTAVRVFVRDPDFVAEGGSLRASQQRRHVAVVCSPDLVVNDGSVLRRDAAHESSRIAGQVRPVRGPSEKIRAPAIHPFSVTTRSPRGLKSAALNLARGV